MQKKIKKIFNILLFYKYAQILFFTIAFKKTFYVSS